MDALSSKNISSADIARVVQTHLQTIASQLRPDVLAALQQAQQTESNPAGAEVLALLVQNAQRAAQTGVPLCQDTGTVWVLIEAGSRVQTDLRDLQTKIDQVVADSFAAHLLRASTVCDAFSDRSNPGTNLPAFVEFVQLPPSSTDPQTDTEVTVHTMLKGAGTDNASRVALLDPSSGAAGITQLVLDAVRQRASTACPPLIIGVGIGGTFDSVAGLSKRALLRPLNAPAATAAATQLQQDLLQAVNASGIGPAALKGDTTALAVQVETAPSHIASLPVAVNLHCHALRSVSERTRRPDSVSFKKSKIHE